MTTQDQNFRHKRRQCESLKSDQSTKMSISLVMMEGKKNPARRRMKRNEMIHRTLIIHIMKFILDDMFVPTDQLQIR